MAAVRIIGCLSLLCLIPLLCLSQGKIMLVGGGSESEGGWSDAPYKWTIDQSANKRIAVISYQEETGFIPNYFMNLGASEATNLKIDSRAKADLQETYDALMSFDVFFFKGGDQSYYYNYFKGTKTELAIRDKFAAGGVISGTSAGMAILSEVIFTAENNSVYPDEVLENYRDSDITLKNDFLDIFPGYIVDSHFTERGRGARLMGFMANWYNRTKENKIGIGVDDRTAFCINEDKKGAIFGTGSVSFYSTSAFPDSPKKLVADSIHVIQLLHGHAINLENLEVEIGPLKFMKPEPNEESGPYLVMLSGTNALSENTLLLNELINNVGSKNDTILVVTSNGSGKNYVNKLNQLKIITVVLETIAENNTPKQILLRNQIRRLRKILFVENNWNELSDFLSDGPTGQLLKTHIKRKGIISTFIGQDSRLAGEMFVSNNLGDKYASYYGKLKYEKGLGLLSTSIIMPDTYNLSSSDYYENNTAAISYALVNFNLTYGIYLNRSGYFKFFSNGDANYFTADGNLSTMVLVNRGTKSAVTTEPVNNAGASRNYSGFTDMFFTLLNDGATLKVGDVLSVTDTPYEFEEVVTATSVDVSNLPVVFPNPSTGIFTIQVQYGNRSGRSLSIYNSIGQLIAEFDLKSTNTNIQLLLDLSDQPNGLYFLRDNQSKTLVRLLKGY